MPWSMPPTRYSGACLCVQRRAAAQAHQHCTCAQRPLARWRRDRILPPAALPRRASPRGGPDGAPPGRGLAVQDTACGGVPLGGCSARSLPHCSALQSGSAGEPGAGWDRHCGIPGLTWRRAPSRSSGGCAAQVENAINRATKEKRLAQLTEALEQSTVVFGLRYNKISVRAPLCLQARRSTSLPCAARARRESTLFCALARRSQTCQAVQRNLSAQPGYGVACKLLGLPALPCQQCVARCAARVNYQAERCAAARSQRAPPEAPAPRGARR